ncbi:glycosyltransferase [Leuconostoc lactis]|uniref:glycosyltransferase n=1 Tax=Leuconostoc lactis TaxID=1246 RepID=UPI00049791DA|nr:glycosyltransferase [Leuconostoc lactis]
MNLEFSVLMSVYFNDSKENLEKSLLSVINQSVVPKEIIIVLDGKLPTDLELFIYNFSKNHSIIKIVALKENKGLGNALAEGTKYITTSLIARMDADDIAIPERFEMQLKMFSQDHTIGIVGGQIAEFQGDKENVLSYRKVPVSDPEIRKFAKYRSPFNHPTIMIKKELLMSVGGYVDYPFLEDYFLWIRILSQTNVKVKNIDKTLVYMRVDDGLYSRRGGLKYLKSYTSLKTYAYKIQFIGISEYLMTVSSMIMSSLFPSPIRKCFYRLFLRRK